MAPEQLRDVLGKRPFEPFRLIQTDGTAFDVRHPDMLMVGKRAAIVGLSPDPKDDLFDRTITLDLLHVIRLEPLPVTKVGGNGQGS